jgi:hypothetical protein
MRDFTINKIVADKPLIFSTNNVITVRKEEAYVVKTGN